MQGKIVKAIAGFYYVYAAGSGIYECKAKGVFRKLDIRPLVGDDVEFEEVPDSEKERTGNVISVLPRKNELRRPNVANVDQAMILMAMKTPDPNLLLLDRFLITMEKDGIPAVICFNKTDLAPEKTGGLADAYRDCGSDILFISVHDGSGMEEVREVLAGKTTVLAGPSGAGKSSLVNAIYGASYMETGEISKKLARGKNTTRHSELVAVADGTYLCDTPGFTALDTADIEKEDLALYYREFRPYEGACFFQPCTHIHEPGCAVREAVRDGRISPVRYEQYAALFEELKEAEKYRYR